MSTAAATTIVSTANITTNSANTTATIRRRHQSGQNADANAEDGVAKSSVGAIGVGDSALSDCHRRRRPRDVELWRSVRVLERGQE